MSRFCALVLTVSACVTPTDAGAPSVTKPFGAHLLKPGDIVFHTSRSSQSKAVQAITGSPYSHMGIIFFDDEKKPRVYEAITQVSTASYEDWVKRGVDSKVVVKRVKTLVPTPDQHKKMWEVARTFRDKPYDLRFLWDDSEIYCSELVYKIYDRALGLQIGKLERYRDIDLTSKAAQKLVAERFPNGVPLDETVISPQSMFADPQLETVYAN